MGRKESNGVDRRVVRSRAAMIAAYERLIARGPAERVTVSAVAREAGVDRKTVYAHFGSIEGLMDAVARDIVDRIMDEVETACGPLIEPEDVPRAVREFFRAMNRAIAERAVPQGGLPTASFSEARMERIMKPLECRVLERVPRLRGVPADRFHAAAAYMLNGILGTYRAWARSDGAVPLERVSETAGELTVLCLEGLMGAPAAKA